MATWDETNPLDSAIVSQFPANERAARAAAKTNFGIDHVDTDGATVGYHEKVTLTEGADQTAVANAVVIYAKESAGVTEFFARDSEGDIVQLTLAGALNAFLSGVTTASSARTALGLGALAVLSTVNDSVWSGTDLAVANGGTGSSTAANARTALGLAIGTDVQAYSAFLAAIVALSKTDGNFIVANGSTFVAENGATARTSLGLGSIATKAITVSTSDPSGTPADGDLWLKYIP